MNRNDGAASVLWVLSSNSVFLSITISFGPFTFGRVKAVEVMEVRVMVKSPVLGELSGMR